MAPMTSDTYDLKAPWLRARRSLFAALVAVTTAIAGSMMVSIVAGSGITVLEIFILALFVPTFAWISVAFWNAVLGFVLLAFRVDPLSLSRTTQHPLSVTPLTTRIAVVMPAFREDPARLVRGLSAVVRSLEATGQGHAFDIHLLSDTPDTEAGQVEREAWEAFRADAPAPERLHYRRRHANTGRKAGNIADFCARWGHDYDFLVVLDADSVMSGETLVRLARTMEENPDVGLIQTVPVPVGQETAFGRFVQFAGALYSPMLAAGQSFWQTDTANYWGHNAILRVKPFAEHGRLPVLPGSPPLGGEVLSHDFVEAALLRRAGWKVYLVQDGGSYEEVPSNVLDFARRDRRWAQGSLQHLRLLGEPGLRWVNRWHFTMGAMGYVSSVLWLLLLLAGTLYVLVPSVSVGGWSGGASPWLVNGPLADMRSLVPLLALTAVVLFGPKVLGMALAWARRAAGFGGRLRLLLSGLVEAVFSVLVAPVMMMVHTRAVVGILAGRDVQWGAQRRDADRIALLPAARHTLTSTGVGFLWAGLTLALSPGFFLWMTPIFAGLLLSGPIVSITSRKSLGRRMRAWGVLTVPTEASCPPELAEEHQAGSCVQTDAPHEQTVFVGDRSTDEGKAKGSMIEAERGLFDLRRGRPLYVTGDDRGVLVQAVEGLDAPALNRLDALASGSKQLVLTPYRARYVRATPDPAAPEAARASTSQDVNGRGVSVRLDREDLEMLFQLASGRGPFDLSARPARSASRLEGAGMALTRLGGMVPATVSVPVDPNDPALQSAVSSGEILTVAVDQIEAMDAASRLRRHVTRVSEAPVPLSEDENARFVLFRESTGLLEHVAILIGDPSHWPTSVPVRIHSACLTGDLFGSLRCDCGEQLRGSLEVFAANGGGILLYMAQEGRGIGLGNKLRAYSLQEQGLDTVDADCVLGFGADERCYPAAVGMLQDLGVQRVRLLTNNPEKMRALEDAGIQVTEREPLHGTLNRHNLPYVRAKVQRAGHWLGDMLHGVGPGQ